MEQQPPSTPERESQVERNPFNIETMTNEEIIGLGRTLAAAADKLSSEDEPPEAGQLEAIWESLQRAVRKLPSRDIERARRLLSEQMASGNPHDIEAAAEWVEGFLQYDYELARDTLIRIYTDGSLAGHEIAFEIIAQRLNGVERQLTPEQRADFEAKLAASRDY